MQAATITIVNRLGLHARAAAQFVNLAKTFSSTIALSKDSEQADGKSIMSVMLLAAPLGTELELSAAGPDEAAAFTALQELIDNRFGEEE
ncbi:MAG: HPr family phosphocarrier protein [Gammaproteobacteria bacterium]|nr:HPr family phosphocarrier protein [Gammaproteobacteria bacterium]